MYAGNVVSRQKYILNSFVVYNGGGVTYKSLIGYELKVFENILGGIFFLDGSRECLLDPPPPFICPRPAQGSKMLQGGLLKIWDTYKTRTIIFQVQAVS